MPHSKIWPLCLSLCLWDKVNSILHRMVVRTELMHVHVKKKKKKIGYFVLHKILKFQNSLSNPTLANSSFELPATRFPPARMLPCYNCLQTSGPSSSSPRPLAPGSLSASHQSHSCQHTWCLQLQMILCPPHSLLQAIVDTRLVSNCVITYLQTLHNPTPSTPLSDHCLLSFFLCFCNSFIETSLI